MKNKFKSLILLAMLTLGTLMSLPTTMEAQNDSPFTQVDSPVTPSVDTGVDTPPVDVPIPDPVTDPNGLVLFFFGNIGGMLLLSVTITGWLTTRLLSNANNTVKQILSWVVVLAVCMFGHVKGYGTWGVGGLFYTTSVALAIGYSIGIAMVANKIWDEKTLNSVIAILGVKTVSK